MNAWKLFTIFLIVVVGFILYFFPNSSVDVSENFSKKDVEVVSDIVTQDDSLISYAENCRYMHYPGSRAFLYGGDPSCDHVYSAAFLENNFEICSYLELDKDKAICIGSSVDDAKEISNCNTLEEKDICILNAVNKISKNDLYDSKTDYLETCEDILNNTLRSICYGFISYKFGDKDVCESLENGKMCLNHYVQKSLEVNDGVPAVERIVSVCNDVFVTDEDLLECYHNFFPGSIGVFVNATSYENSAEILGYSGEEILSFYDLEELTGNEIILLSTKETFRIASSDKEKVAIPSTFSLYQSSPDYYAYFRLRNYICDSAFEDGSLIDNNCDQMLNLNVGLPDFGSSSKWGYYQTYFRDF